MDVEYSVLMMLNLFLWQRFSQHLSCTEVPLIRPVFCGGKSARRTLPVSTTTWIISDNGRSIFLFIYLFFFPSPRSLCIFKQECSGGEKKNQQIFHSISDFLDFRHFLCLEVWSSSFSPFWFWRERILLGERDWNWWTAVPQMRSRTWKTRNHIN